MYCTSITCAVLASHVLYLHHMCCTNTTCTVLTQHVYCPTDMPIGGADLVMTNTMSPVTNLPSVHRIYTIIHILLYVHSNGGAIDLLTCQGISHFNVDHHGLSSVHIKLINTNSDVCTRSLLGVLQASW